MHPLYEIRVLMTAYLIIDQGTSDQSNRDQGGNI